MQPNLKDTPTAVAILVRWRPDQLAWGGLRLPLAAIRQSTRPATDNGLEFQKFLGSGSNGGFQMKPSIDHQGWFGVFKSEQQANRFIAKSKLVSEYRARSQDCLILGLQPYQSRGSWSGFSLEPTPDKTAKKTGPIVSLTRASIRLTKTLEFWRQSPDAQRDLAQADGCLLAIGLGEMPLIRQATLSLWRNESDLVAYAQTGAHRRAIQAAYGGDFFSESMFTRFELRSATGHWRGQHYG
jgi:spheroidene monooxygenase